MSKKIIALMLLVVALVGCDSLPQGLQSTYNMVNCKYTYKSISNLSVSGMNLNNGLSLTQIPKITSILSGTSSSIPLDFTLNLNVENPNQTEALLHGLQYVVSIDGIQFTSGSLNQSLSIASGQSQTLPLTIGVDLATLMKNESKDAVVDITKNFLGIGSKESNVTVQLKPSFKIGGQTIASPVYIPVSFSFGGK